MKKQPTKKVLFLIPAGVILAGTIVFLCTRGQGDDSVCKENVARLQTLEDADISQTEQQLQDLKFLPIYPHVLFAVIHRRATPERRAASATAAATAGPTRGSNAWGMI